VGDIKKVVLDDASVLYYTFTKEETKEYKYLGYYTAATMPAKEIKPLVTVDDTYLMNNEDGTATLLITFLNGKVELVDEVPEVDNTITEVKILKTWATVIIDDKLMYEYEFVDGSAGIATSSGTKGDMYYFNRTSGYYEPVPADAYSVKTYTGFINNKDKTIIETNDGGLHLVSADVVIWGIDEDGNRVLFELKDIEENTEIIIFMIDDKVATIIVK
jgi:hypothetical protein